MLVKYYNFIPCMALTGEIYAQLKAFESFLNNRDSTVRLVNNILPQGFILAPLLFNVYTADILKTVPKKVIYTDS